MSESDLLNDILSSNPNEPAAKGALLLLRTEMKSEFGEVGRRFDRVDQRLDRVEKRLDEHDARFDRIDRSLDLIAQQIGVLVARAPATS